MSTMMCRRDSMFGGEELRELALERRDAVKEGQLELGSSYWGTGTYFIEVGFHRENKDMPWGKDWTPLWKHFSIDTWRRNARVACGEAPLVGLGANLADGCRRYSCCEQMRYGHSCACSSGQYAVMEEVDVKQGPGSAL
ncbi:hypothetical protein BD311DRAFT_770165 [Dichomitus squalens]|uniref:Uncharacterized protein n=1 Tax=Dichomitus squalens TaxID=114155 RepID=A0A4Q9M846_9APHY|nr:hypothetical protein BD311DRAFT_770165 [Dichomitus squalens]